MINAYSLAAETLEGTLDETYPVISKISEMKLRPQKMRLSDKTLMLLKNFSTITATSVANWQTKYSMTPKWTVRVLTV